MNGARRALEGRVMLTAAGLGQGWHHLPLLLVMVNYASVELSGRGTLHVHCYIEKSLAE